MITKFQGTVYNKITENIPSKAEQIAQQCYKMFVYSQINNENIPQITLINKQIIIQVIILILLSVNIYTESKRTPLNTIITVPAFCIGENQINQAEIISTVNSVSTPSDVQFLEQKQTQCEKRIYYKKLLIEQILQLREKIVELDLTTKKDIDKQQLQEQEYKQQNKIDYKAKVEFVESVNQKVKEIKLLKEKQQQQLNQIKQLNQLYLEQINLREQKQQILDNIKSMQKEIDKTVMNKTYTIFQNQTRKFKHLKLTSSKTLSYELCQAIVKIHQRFLVEIYQDKSFLQYIQKQFIIDECYCGYCQQCKTLIKYYKTWIQQ